jgi:hypothetical protein
MVGERIWVYDIPGGGIDNGYSFNSGDGDGGESGDGLVVVMVVMVVFQV